MYKVRNENRKLPKTINSNLSLYSGCLKIEQVPGGIVLNDDGRMVSFWCTYHNCIKIGFQAKAYEREQIASFYGINLGVSK